MYAGFFRRRVNTAIDELNTRLDTRIQPFKLTRKQTLVDQLMYDQEVVRAAEEEASKTGTPIAVVMAKAERYAREIVPSFFSPGLFWYWNAVLPVFVSRLIYRVRVGYVNDEALSAIDPNSSVVFCHEPPLKHGLSTSDIPGIHKKQLFHMRLESGHVSGACKA